MEEEEFNPTEVYEWDRNCAPTFIATIINVMLNLMMLVPIWKKEWQAAHLN